MNCRLRLMAGHMQAAASLSAHWRHAKREDGFTLPEGEFCFKPSPQVPSRCTALIICNRICHTAAHRVTGKTEKQRFSWSH